MSIIDKVGQRFGALKPLISECAIVARPLPLIADEIIEAGDDFRFKVVFDPTDRHLQQIEPARRLELMKGPFARGAVVILAIHKPTDRAIGRPVAAHRVPAAGDTRAGCCRSAWRRDVPVRPLGARGRRTGRHHDGLR